MIDEVFLCRIVNVFELWMTTCSVII